MRELKRKIWEALLPDDLTYVGIIIRILVILGIQSCFQASPFNYHHRPAITLEDWLIGLFIFFPGVMLFGIYGMYAVVRIGKIGNSELPWYELIIGLICLVIVILFTLYTMLTTHRPPWSYWGR